MIGIIVLLIVILIVYYIVRSVRAQGKKFEEEKIVARNDTEETYGRIKNAIATDQDSYFLDGFRAFEDSDWIKNYTAYPKLIKPMCVELVRNGYDFGQYISDTSYGYWVHEVAREYEAIITIAKGKEEQGTISMFGTHRYEGLSRHCRMRHYNNYYGSQNGGSRTKLPHMIMHDDLLICLQSKTSMLEPTPEWLAICANFIKRYFPEFKDPEWMEKIPDAKNYVNSMF